MAHWTSLGQISEIMIKYICFGLFILSTCISISDIDLKGVQPQCFT